MAIENKNSTACGDPNIPSSSGGISSDGNWYVSTTKSFYEPTKKIANQLIIDLDHDLDQNMIAHLKNLIKREEDKLIEKNKNRKIVQNEEGNDVDVTNYKHLENFTEELLRYSNGNFYYLKKCGIELFKTVFIDKSDLKIAMEKIKEIESDEWFISWLIPEFSLKKDSDTVVFTPYTPDFVNTPYNPPKPTFTPLPQIVSYSNTTSSVQTSQPNK